MLFSHKKSPQLSILFSLAPKINVNYSHTRVFTFQLYIRLCHDTKSNTCNQADRNSSRESF